MAPTRFCSVIPGWLMIAYGLSESNVPSRGQIATSGLEGGAWSPSVLGSPEGLPAL